MVYVYVLQGTAEEQALLMPSLLKKKYVLLIIFCLQPWIIYIHPYLCLQYVQDIYCVQHVFSVTISVLQSTHYGFNSSTA